jgi:uncharacterized membrane protein
MNGIFRFSGPDALPFLAFVLAIIILIFLIPLLMLGLAGAAFSRLGFSWIEAVCVILLMLMGYFVNIPIRTFTRTGGSDSSTGAMVYDAFTGEPVPDERSTTLVSLNLGGAVIPFVVSVYLLYEMERMNAGQSFLLSLVCLIAVAFVVMISAKIIPDWGIRAPLFLPSVTALACGLLLTGGTGLAAAVTAFSGGTMGLLVGITGLLFRKGFDQGIRQCSIGGAGAFGSVFLCILLSTLIA